MPKKIWISEHESIDIEGDALEGEFAPRSRSIDFFGMWSYLPDPDPVLKKLGQDMSVYRELLTDAHVWACYESRTAGTLSREWGLVQPDRGEASEKIMDACEDMLDGLDVVQILTDALDAPWFGMAPLEITWRRDGRMWYPASVVGKPQEWFAFDGENNPVFLSIDNPMGEPLPPMKFIIPRHHASYRNPYGERVLSRCFWPVTFKKGGWKFWTVFAEKFGMPFITGKVPRGTQTADRERLLSNLAAMVQDAVAVINDDESVDLTEAAGKSSSAGVYSDLIEAADRAVSKATLGQNLSTELTQGGSYAATSSHMEVRSDIVDKDKRPCRTTMNTLLAWFTAINYGPGETPPKFDFYEEEDVQGDRADRDKTLNEQGVRFTKKYYAAQYKLEDDDFDLADPSPTQPGPGAPAPQFAEGRPEQMGRDDADAIADAAARQTAQEFETLLAPVLDMIESADSLEEIGEKIYDLYPTLDTDRFQEILARALLAAGGVGMGAVQGEVE